MRTNSRLTDSAGRVKQRPALGQALLVSLSKITLAFPMWCWWSVCLSSPRRLPAPRWVIDLDRDN